MRKVIGVGETVLDIVFKHEQPIGALPGGSVFNTIVSLGRVGADATFISAVCYRDRTSIRHRFVRLGMPTIWAFVPQHTSLRNRHALHCLLES